MNGQYDLMYIGEEKMYEECQREILADFPDCSIKDASDDIHRYRFEVQHTALTQKDWLLWLLRKGWFESSLTYQFSSMTDSENLVPLMRQVVEERKAAQP